MHFTSKSIGFRIGGTIYSKVICKHQTNRTFLKRENTCGSRAGLGCKREGSGRVDAAVEGSDSPVAVESLQQEEKAAAAHPRDPRG